MIQDVHSRKINLPVTLTAGSNTVIPAVAGAWIYVHEVIGDLDKIGTLQFLSGSTSLATFSLDAGQGITVTDEPGEDNRPRFECKPGDAFIVVVGTGCTFTGNVHYSLRY